MPELHSNALVIRPAATTRPLGMTRASLPRIPYIYRGTGHDAFGNCQCGEAGCPAERKDSTNA